MKYQINQETFKLATELFENKHLEESIEIFSTFIHSENPSKEDAIFYILDALCSLRENSKAIELYENNHFPSGLPDDIEYELAICYFREGNINKGLVLLQRHLEKYPYIDPDFYVGKDSKVPRKIKIKKEVKYSIKHGISPFALFEYILPVFLGIREACCCFLDELLIQYIPDKKECSLFEHLASVIYSRYELRLFSFDQIVISYDREGNENFYHIRKIYVYKSSRIADLLTKLKDDHQKKMVSDGIMEAERFFEKKEGQLLGYPICCTKSFVSLRFSNYPTKDNPIHSNSLEKIASKDLIHYLHLGGDPDEDLPFTYFTSEFYPCQPDCSKAASIGKKHFEKYREMDNKLAYIFEYILFSIHLIRVCGWPDDQTASLRHKMVGGICNYLKLKWDGEESIRSNLESNMGDY